MDFNFISIECVIKEKNETSYKTKFIMYNIYRKKCNFFRKNWSKHF